jgi:predicted rRNA methylase YqxC with S4 and FtsJ domains
MAGKRLDAALAERGLAESREKAQALIMCGIVSWTDRRPSRRHGRIGRGDIEVRGARSPM